MSVLNNYNLKIVIFGESHTRSFSFINNLIPVFMGPGRVINLEKKNIKHVDKQIRSAKSKLPDGDYFFCTLLGEPNVRFQLDNDWHVFKNPNFVDEGEVNYAYLESCIENYKDLIKSLDFDVHVITPTTAFNPSIKSMVYFNKLLKKKFGKKVIDIFSGTLSNGIVMEKYQAPNFDLDPIHLNSLISEIFFDTLLSKKIITEDDLKFHQKTTTEVFSSNDLQKEFNRNNFGTWNLK